MPSGGSSPLTKYFVTASVMQVLGTLTVVCATTSNTIKRAPGIRFATVCALCNGVLGSKRGFATRIGADVARLYGPP